MIEVTFGDAMRQRKAEDTLSHLQTHIGGAPFALFLVADGHGGAATAHHLRGHLLERIAAKASSAAPADLEAACTACFKEIHAETQGPKFEQSGATCTVIVVNMETAAITCANVGDSQAFLVEEEGDLVEELTVMHRFDSQSERERAVRNGAHLGQATHPATKRPYGPLRAWPGGLGMSRAIGDADCSVWLTADPSVRTRAMPASGCSVVLATDGVWDSLDAGEVCAIALGVSSQTEAAAAIASKSLKGQRSGVRDDITVMVVRVAPEGKPRAPRSASKLDGLMGRLHLGRRRAAGAPVVLSPAKGSPLAPDSDISTKGGTEFATEFAASSSAPSSMASEPAPDHPPPTAAMPPPTLG